MIKILKDALKKIKKDDRILAVALFGSYARDEEYRDIDLALILNKKMTKKEMSKIKVEYLSKINPKIDLHIFQQLPIYIRFRVLKEGKILLSKEDSKLYEIALINLKEYEFYKKIYSMYLENVENR
ncbi:MAG: nucleotidyltransferase family protein [Minisyncoccales bacterium]